MDNGIKSDLTFVSIIVLGIYTFTLFFSWFFHARDRAELTVSPMHIAFRTEEYSNVMEQTKMLDEGDAAFRANADSPVSSLVHARDSAVQRLRGSKAYRVNILKSIITRCNGPWRPIVALADNITCAEYRAMKF